MHNLLRTAALALGLLAAWPASAQVPLPTISLQITLPPGAKVPKTLKEVMPYLSSWQRQRISHLSKVYDAKDDTSALVRYLDDDDAEVRKYAIEVLVYHGEGSLESIYEGATGSNARIRSMAVWTLRRISPKGDPELFPLLLRLLKDPDFQIRLNACALLSRTDNRAVRPLIDMLEDRHELVRSKAAEVLGFFKGDSEEAVPFLVDRLADRSAEVRRCAASAIAQIGSWAIEFAEDELMRALSDPDNYVRSRAASALSASDDRLPLFVKGLADPQERRRSACAAALTAAGPRAVPALVESLENDNPQVRFWAAFALGQIGKPAEWALPTLTTLASQDLDSQVRFYATAAIQKIRK